MAKEIPLTQGKVAIVDDEDYRPLMRRTWCAHKSSTSRQTYYAVNAGLSAVKHGKTSFLMHRIIMNAPDGLEVDHIDGDGLNNRKSNLRLATPSQNRMNCGPSKRNTSGYIGIYQYRPGGARWCFSVRVDGKNKVSGGFDSPEDAARARDVEARKHYGEFAKLNFPALEAC